MLAHLYNSSSLRGVYVPYVQCMSPNIDHCLPMSNSILIISYYILPQNYHCFVGECGNNRFSQSSEHHFISGTTTGSSGDGHSDSGDDNGDSDRTMVVVACNDSITKRMLARSPAVEQRLWMELFIVCCCCCFFRKMFLCSKTRNHTAQ